MLWSPICCPCLFPDKVNVSYSLYILLVILIYWVLVLQQSLEKTLKLKFRKTDVYVYNSISYYKTATEWKCSFFYLKYLKKACNYNIDKLIKTQTAQTEGQLLEILLFLLRFYAFYSPPAQLRTPGVPGGESSSSPFHVSLLIS